MTGIASFQKSVSVDKIHPNSHNPNHQSERVQEATRESVSRFGFIDPVTVRAHPDLPGEYEIIDGEHRWLAAKDTGLDKVSVIVLDVTDAEAKKLTIVLNETRGKSDQRELAELLADLAVDDHDLLNALPYTQDQLDDLLALAAVDPDLTPSDPGGGGGTEGWKTINCRVPLAVGSLFEDVSELIAARGSLHSDSEIGNGQILEALCAEYLSGAQQATVPARE